jgi:inosine-uridine nucleoside N-ribohydrolase
MRIAAALILLFVSSSLTTAAADQPERIIFDTDSGLFGDDGASLVMLARSPGKVSIAGITVVSGNVWAPQGAVYMFHILDLLKRNEVPLYMGAQMPLVHSSGMSSEENRRWGPLEFDGAFGQPFPTSAKALMPPFGGKFSRLSARPQNAVDFLIETIDRNPGRITVLGLGPLTNLAMAIRLRPDIESKIGRLMLMGGSVHVPGNASKDAEFNFWFDPEAAQIVMRSKIPVKIMFGLDICNQARITRALFNEIVAAKTPITRLYAEDLGNRYPGFYKKADAPPAYMWDAVTAAYLIDSSIVTRSETMYLDIKTQFSKSYGAVTKLDRKIAPDATPAQVMMDLNFPKAWRIYKELLTQR